MAERGGKAMAIAVAIVLRRNSEKRGIVKI